MKMNYGLIAIDKEGNIHHFCGYEKEPTEKTKSDLFAELHEDPEFNYLAPALDNETIVIIEAPEELVNYLCSENIPIQI